MNRYRAKLKGILVNTNRLFLCTRVYTDIKNQFTLYGNVYRT
jgi:hypothetical protein